MIDLCRQLDKKGLDRKVFRLVFCPNPYTDPGNPENQWVYGDMQQPSAAVNADLIKLGLIYPYVPNIAVFKCPADRRTVYFGKTVPPGGVDAPTVRSMSMNGYMNPIVDKIITEHCAA